MSTLRKILVGDPVAMGAKICADEEIVEIIKNASDKEPKEVNPFAKIVGILLADSSKIVVVKGNRDGSDA